MIYFLDGNQEVIKIVRSSAVISAIQTQELPEDNSLLRDYLSVRLKNDERLFNAQYMAIKSYGGNRNAFDLYRIASELVPDNATEFVGIQVAPYELEGVVIEDLRPQNRPLNQTMNQVLEGSDWRIGYVADNLPNVTTNFYYMSVKDALKKIQELTNVEMLFKVEISGNKITDKWVEVYHQLGNRTMKRFNYGTNALSVVRESSHDELYTALIGRGKGEEVGETESGDATHGRKINFADVEWKKSAGNPVDKPKGQKYIELPQATTEYGIKLIDGRKIPRIGIVEFSETDDPEVLIEQAYQELLVRARPKVLFKASVINTGDMLIGDTVTIHRHDLDFHYQARCRKVVRDRKNNNKTQVEIGDVVHTASTKRQGQINSALNNVAGDLENVRGEVTEARQSADGKNTNFYGNVEPIRKKVGDTWFRDHPSLTGESQILVWNGEAWELIMDTSDTTKNAREIEAVIEQAQNDKTELEEEIGNSLLLAKTHAQSEDARIRGELESEIGGAIEVAEQAKADAVTKANQALEDAKTYADSEDARIKQEIGLEVDGAIEIAEQAKADAVTKANQALQGAKEYAEAEDARIKGELETSIGGAIDLAEQAKSDASSKANQAYEDAKAHADSEISQFSEHFDGVLAEVESDVADAQATADSAAGQINTAVTNAGFTSLDETISNVRGIASGVKSELDIAIENAGFTSLDATLQNMNHITMNAEQSAQQAVTNASDAYGLAQTSISEAQTAQANSLTALGKADNALDGVSNLDIRVDDVEAELELKADNTFMNEDGTLTTLSNAIAFNAHRFSSDMSRIESRVESLSGEINLVILRDAFDGKALDPGDTFPNPSRVRDPESTMREMIKVVPGEKLALTKETVASGSNYWRINFYDSDSNYVDVLHTNSNEELLTIPSNVHYIWVSYTTGSKPQIVRGEHFIPYRPNLADQMTADEVTIFRNEYDEFADMTERRLSAVDSTGGRLDVLNNRITTEAGLVRTDMTALINTKVSDTDFAEFYQNEYLETAQEVSRKISLNDVLVGGRNLIKNSSFYSGFESWFRSSPTAVVDEAPRIPHPFVRMNNQLDYDIRVEQIVDVEPVTDYVFSYTLHRKGTVILAELDGDGTEVSRVALDRNGNYSRYSHELKTSPNTGKIRVVLLADPTEHPLFYAIQLEKGNVLSDWERAPEDVDTQLNHIQTEWTQTFDTFSQTVSSIDGRVTSQKQTLDGLETTIQSTQSDLSGTMTLLNQTKQTVDSRTSVLAQLRTDVNGKATISQFNTLSSTVDGTVARVGNAEGKITQIETNVNGLQSTVADKASQSQVTQLANGLSSVVADFSNLEIGGRNLLLDSADVMFRGGTRTTRMGKEAVVLNAPFSSAYITPREQYSEDVVLGETYTISFLTTYTGTKGSSLELYAGAGLFDYQKVTNYELVENGKYVRVYVTAKATGNMTPRLHLNYNGTGVLYVTDFKIEKGNKATGWTPAPEDTDAKIDHIETEWTQTFDTFSQTVSDNQGKVNLQLQTLENSLSSIVDPVTGRLSIVEQTADGLESTVASKASQNQVTQLSDLLSSTVEDVEGNATQISQLADNINLRVSKGELLSQINIEAERTLIQSNRLVLDANSVVFTGSAFIPSAQIQSLHADKINAGTINSARINSTEIVTQGLTANVIKSTHIETNTATIDKLFANEAMINRLTSKTAFINNIKAVEIDASKITSGTIDTARLNASDIVTKGLTANVIKSTHLETSTATIDKLFANDAMVNTLTAKTAFISSVKAVDIDAARITSGTIDTARLNASEIVTKGLTADVIEAEHILADTATIDKLFATKANIDVLTSKTAFIDSIKAVEIDASKITSGTINTARINAIDIVTKGLTADAIKSTHILADTALFDKLFTSTLATDRLSAQTAWIKNGMFANASIDGAKIQDATIGSAKIASLDVNKLSGNKGSWIMNEFNSAQSTTTITGDGISIGQTSGSRSARLTERGYEFWRDGTEHGLMYTLKATDIDNQFTGKHTVSLGAEPDSYISLTVRNDLGVWSRSLSVMGDTGEVGIHRTLNMWASDITRIGALRFIYSQGNTIASGVDTVMRHTFSNAIRFNYVPDQQVFEIDRTGIHSYGITRLYSAVAMGGNHINDLGMVTFNRQPHNNRFYTNSLDQLHLGFHTRLRVMHGDSEVMAYTGAMTYSYRNINMDGNSVTNQSDERLKRDIKDTEIDSLSIIEDLRFVGFNWKDSEMDNRLGRQMGIIAQESPYLAEYDAETDSWSVNSSKQIMMNSHAIQQLAFMEENTNKVASQALQLGESNKSEIDELREENKELRKRIEELESVM